MIDEVASDHLQMYRRTINEEYDKIIRYVELL